MKKLAYLFVVCFALLVAPSVNPANAQKAGGTSVEEEIKALTGKVFQAGAKGDTSVLEKYYADDCLIIHGDGKVTTKAQEMKDFRSGDLKYEVNENESKIQMYGDTAVANLLAHVKGTIHGQQIDTDLRSTRVWKKQNGNWKVIVVQITRLAPATQ